MKRAGWARTHTGAGRKQQAYDSKDTGFQISSLKSQTGAGTRGWHDRLTGAGQADRGWTGCTAANGRALRRMRVILLEITKTDDE